MNERDQLLGCLRIMSSVLRDLGLIAVAGRRGGCWPMPTCAPSSRRCRGRYDANRSVRAYTAVDEALAALERNANPKVVADWLVLQL